MNYISHPILFLSFLFLIVSFGCSNTSSQTEVHPIPDLLPHSGFKGYEVARDESKKNNELLPWQIELLQQTLSDSSSIVQKQLPFKFHNSFGVYWVSLPGRLVAYHVGSDYLFEIDLITLEAYQVAGPGNGPSEISYSTSLFQARDTIYIAGSDGRVRSFDCTSTPCEYSNSFKIEQSIRAGTVSTEGIALMTQQFMTEENRSENFESVHVYDYTGTFKNRFGESYQSNNWMVRDLYSQGDLEFDEKAGVYILYFSHIPNLYFYSVSMELIDVIKIPNFEQSQVFYDTKSGGRSVEINSLITRLNRIDDRKYALRVSHNYDTRDDEGRPVYNRKHEFYYLKADENKLRFVGEYTHRGYEIKDIQITERGIVMSCGGINYFVGKQWDQN